VDSTLGLPRFYYLDIWYTCQRVNKFLAPFPGTLFFVLDYLWAISYTFLIHEKSQSLDVFKTFKVEVENQLNKRIKCVRSDRGGEYYDRYDGSGEQLLGPFARYLEEYGIIPQYTMLGSPSMNGVA